MAQLSIPVFVSKEYSLVIEYQQTPLRVEEVIEQNSGASLNGLKQSNLKELNYLTKEQWVQSL